MKLGTPIQVGPMTFKNRTYHLPIGGPGHRSDEALNYYKARARGGVAALTTGGLADLDIMRNPTDELKRFADMVHSAAPDCYVGTQTLVLYGPEKKGSGIGPHGSGERGAAPSATWSPATEQSIANNFADPNPYEITREEIHAITEQLAEAAAGQKSAGYDFAELHATHAYIWRQFLSPMDNKREDEYGGSIENRIRWPVEAVRAMKAAAGEDFGITFRLAAMEPEFNGISLADSCRAAQLLQEAGVDALIISEGANSHNRGFISSCVPLQISYDRNCFAQWAEAIKKVVDIPVVAVGRITQPDEAEEILQSGQADIIGMARQLMVDPEWPNKATSGAWETVMPCLGCNVCFDRREYDHMTCSVNARLCNEEETEYSSAEKEKKVMVVGSGPAGMEAARIAADRGHDVTIYEKQARLGGLLYSAAAGPGKRDVDDWRKFLEMDLVRTGVKIKLETPVDAELVKEVNPDALILAIGATPRGADVKRAEGTDVVPAETAITGEVPVGQKVVVIGGGMVGLETAEHLANQGKAVTVVARSELARDYSFMNRPAMLDNVAMAGVISYEHTALEEIASEGARVTIDGESRVLEADTVVMAIGSNPEQEFINSLKALVVETYVVGDANGNTRFREGVIEGHAAARAL